MGAVTKSTYDRYLEKFPPKDCTITSEVFLYLLLLREEEISPKKITENLYYVKKDFQRYFIDTSNKGVVVVFKINEKENKPSLDFMFYERKVADADVCFCSVMINITAQDYTVFEEGKSFYLRRSIVSSRVEALPKNIGFDFGKTTKEERAAIAKMTRKYSVNVPQEWLAFLSF